MSTRIALSASVEFWITCRAKGISKLGFAEIILFCYFIILMLWVALKQQGVCRAREHKKALGERYLPIFHCPLIMRVGKSQQIGTSVFLKSSTESRQKCGNKDAKSTARMLNTRGSHTRVSQTILCTYYLSWQHSSNCYSQYSEHQTYNRTN